MRSLTFLLFLVPCRANATLGAVWSYENLYKQSDLVVIATPKSTVETGSKLDIGWRDREFHELRTAFDVKHVLKGRKRVKQLTLVHCRRQKQPSVTFGGPGVATFSLDGVSLHKGNREVNISGGPLDYLLFLKKRRDGLYKPTSGQFRAAASARVLAAIMSLPPERAAENANKSSPPNGG